MNETRTTALGNGGVKLAVRVFDGPGPDARGLLLHHGLASSSHIWDLMLPHLVRRFRTVAYDARGHRDSSKPSSGYGFDHVVADALAVMRSVGLRSPVVVGHSWGAMAALELVAHHPGAAAGAVLIDGGVVGLRREMPEWRTARERLAPPRIAGTPVRDFTALLRTIFEGSLDYTPELEQTLLRIVDADGRGRIRPNVSFDNHLRILRAIWEQDPIPLYRRLRNPVLVVLSRPTVAHGDEATFLEAKRRAVAEARRAARGRPVRFEWMEGIHDLPLQHPARLARRITRFAAQAVG